LFQISLASRFVKAWYDPLSDDEKGEDERWKTLSAGWAVEEFEAHLSFGWAQPWMNSQLRSASLLITKVLGVILSNLFLWRGTMTHTNIFQMMKSLIKCG
jgi:hypothetical protein